MAEREWREPGDARPARLALALVLAAAAALRLWSIGHGIPYAVSVDEPEIVERAFHMMKTGTLNPQFFDYGQLIIYIQLVVSVVRFIVGAVTGAWNSLADATSASFYLWGRVVTALFGVATVLLLYRIGLRWGARQALLAASLLAVMPLHVRYSHYVLTDVPLTFFVTLTLLLALGAHERRTARAFALAGAAAGLAAAVKYNGGLALVMPLIACAMTRAARPSRLMCLAATMAGAAAAFLIAAPYTLLDLPGFLDRFARLTAEYRTANRHLEPVAILYLKHLRLQFDWPGMVLVGCGLILALVRSIRGPNAAGWAMALLFPVMYFFIVSQQHIVYARYLLPLVPMLCLVAAAAVITGVGLLRRYEFSRAVRTALIATLTIALLGPPAVTAVSFNRLISRTSTVDLAYAWLEENVPAGSTIAHEGGHFKFSASPYRERRMTQLRYSSYEAYLASDADYLIASSQAYGPYLRAPREHRQAFAEYMTLFTKASEVARFTPEPGQPGPELRIFKVNR